MALAGGAFCCRCITTGSVGVTEFCGKFSGLAPAGFQCIAWPCQDIVGLISLRVRQLDVECETKTKDNVFVNCVVSVQYQTVPEKVYEAFYRLTNPDEQIRSYVFDVVRSTLPTLDLDEAFEAKDDIAVRVKDSLDTTMKNFGYNILQALVTDITPDMRVRDAMNEINASKRLKEAAMEKAEGDKIRKVKEAEADAESKYLSGVGVARQRKAIVDGLRDSIVDFSGNIKGTNSKDVMDLLLLVQYFDTLNHVGGQPNNITTFLPAQSGSFEDMIRNGVLTSGGGMKRS
mmetsp:Transcript_10493/g.13624  ORF Transcript_10493/g.13624 Transcript_10493/m.13624 type:complete len:288 (-) Transcript_10493:206-1069(-)|eukprot:CAMPEP_0117759174 /NCGR_PEP_ID=MMETSP0947-20121206/15855_1 /TAXON_ID=44440 /ORGANISM="Chattonella subsalsa, Strain CCMP2191" /LENGTH=287 /DNA_ID=CAMNT_0005579579 /DNA_START=77 /DNA_END=940 /DNA_ORIENTATION=+